MKIWFSSDLHFGHNKDFMYEPRGFHSIKEHDEIIIKNWNEIVKPEDKVYILGDLMLNDTDAGIEKVNQLNGRKVIILGNHDTPIRIERYREELNDIIDIMYAYQFKYNKHYLYLSHYPTITANYDDDKPWAKHLINLFGHTHQKEKFYNNNPYMYNVGLDANDNKPVSIDEILERIKEKKMEMDREDGRKN